MATSTAGVTVRTTRTEPTTFDKHPMNMETVFPRLVSSASVSLRRPEVYDSFAGKSLEVFCDDLCQPIHPLTSTSPRPKDMERLLAIPFLVKTPFAFCCPSLLNTYVQSLGFELAVFHHSLL